LLRRLHSLSGVVPIGVFLCVHLLTNSSIVWGQWTNKNEMHGGVAEFLHDVEFIHSLPFLFLIELFGLWLPIAFHAGLGIVYAVSGKSNLTSYAYQDNVRYTLQRLSGYLGVIFIFLHVSSLRWGWTYGGLLPVFEAEAAASTTAEHFQGETGLHAFIVTAFYLVSVSALAFHFANGLWTFAITWGLTISVQAQKRWGYICAGLGAFLIVLGVAAALGFATLDIEKAREVEQQIHMETRAETPEMTEPGVPDA
jgi:succinate dehydrogenase / fumarate reductase cytochrome b subunit